MRQQRFAAALTLILGFSFIALFALTPAPAVAAPATPAALETEIVDVTAILEPGDDIEVRVLVRNTGESVIKDGALELRFRSAQLISRSAVDMWELPEDDEDDATRATGQVVTKKDLADLDGGQERVETLRISTDKLYLPKAPGQWGPRGIAVDTKMGEELVDRERTFVLWFPANAENLFPTQVSVLAPLTGTPPGGEGGEAQGERLQNILDATRDHEVAFALDPQLLAGGETAVGLAQLREALEGKEVFALPHFDADVMALAHVDEIDAENYIAGARSAISSDLGTTASDVLLWPESYADQELARLAAEFEAQGVGAIVASDTQLTPLMPLTYTPSGKTRVLVDSSVVPTLLTENTMSMTLTAAATDGVMGSTVRARQRLLADSAVITQERPSDPRHVLLTVPRTWNPDPKRAAELLSALAQAPWVEMEAVRSLIGAPASEIDREALPAHHVDSTEIDARLIREAAAAQRSVSTFRSIVAQPESVLPLADAQLEGIVANGWRHAPEDRERLVGTVAGQAAELQDSVNVIAAGAVNLITEAGEIPVLINNEFVQDVAVTLRLQTDSSFLKTDKPVAAELPAGAETSVLIPVEAIGNRDVDVRVQLETADGTQIGAAETITVRVRAGWEDAGTRVVGAVLVVLFIIGIIRTIRRGRKRMES